MKTVRKPHLAVNYARILILCGTAALCIAMGQSRQPFDVAAIKINTIGANAGTGLAFDGSRLRITNATLQYLIRTAYKIQGEQVVGGPAWLDDERYAVEASASQPTPTPDQLRAMLQNLLEDRFGLAFHRETKQMTVNALVVEKGGVRLKEDTDAGATSLSTDMNSGTAVLSGTRVSMEQFAGYISNKLARVVLNRTNLNGVYDFTFTWDTGQAVGSTDPLMFAGLREQLGLRLEVTKSPVEVLVIEHAGKPSAN